MRNENTLPDEKAIAMLPPGEYVHTFLNPAGMLIGADWKREEIVSLIKTHGAEPSGGKATAMGHGLAVNDGERFVFIQTVAGRNHE